MGVLLPEPKLAIPAFLDKDTNGHALKIAIEKALEKLKADVAAADRCLFDVDSMPEWRLDEMAWEWNMVWYDYAMPVEIKREMVRRAEEISRGIGTPGLLKRMMETVFESVNVIEAEGYGGEPYHFMLEIGGNRAGDMEAWAQRAVDIFKPLRCVFDGFIIQTTEADKIQVSPALEIAIRLKVGE